MVVHHRNATVRGYRLFYRDAGPTDSPTVVLLHGFPASSFMFRQLIPVLAKQYRVIAPDSLGFGLSDAPPTPEFTYSFQALADLTDELLVSLGVERFALCVHDCGADVGWRLALRDPDSIRAIVTLNGNGYDAGFAQTYWKPRREYWHYRTSTAEDAVRESLTFDGIRWRYLHGVTDESVISPDTWHHDHALASRPGNDLIQLQLLRDHQNNLPLYPELHAYLSTSRVPLMAVWGRHSEIFGPEGAFSFADDAPDAEIHLVDGGHFLLESHLDITADYILAFLDRSLR